MIYLQKNVHEKKFDCFILDCIIFPLNIDQDIFFPEVFAILKASILKLLI